MKLSILEHLDRLVGMDTQNPPRDITADHAIFDYLRHQLHSDFQLRQWDHGGGWVSLRATRGETRRLFNFHLDTVPVCPGWETNPFVLTVRDDRAYGLGACDIKGASACMLAALEACPDTPIALLFTSDEEAGSSTCVKKFLETAPPYDSVVVAEPTEVKAVTEHRGIITGRGQFSGRSGHAAYADADRDSATHHAVEWSTLAMQYARGRSEEGSGPLQGIRLNLGRIDGGIKANMIAASAEVIWGCRPAPDIDSQTVREDLEALGRWEQPVRWSPGFEAPSLPSGPDARARADRAAQQATEWGLSLAAPVDFWTEAALFSQAGLDAIVFGPGHIAQAHTAGEWVTTEDLERTCASYREMLR